MSLTALANFFDSHLSGKNYFETKDTPNEQVAAIASKSLANQVVLDYRAVRFILCYLQLYVMLSNQCANVFTFSKLLAGCFLSNIRRLGQVTGFFAHGCSPS